MSIHVKLSKLEATRNNPRRVKPERDAHQRLVASIRAHGLLEPLIVQPTGEKGHYRVIAGNRRLAALRVVYRGQDPAIDCVERDADANPAEIGLAENFIREPMHPLDEAETFAKLASVGCKGVSAIAADFGVSETYVRQRIRLAGLAEPIKAAFRQNLIGVGIAEALTAVPIPQQEALWKECGGKLLDADHVRSLIVNDSILATHALFDLAEIPASALIQDLFGEELRIERQAFMEAQARTLATERVKLLEEGWSGATCAPRQALSDYLVGTVPLEAEPDEATKAAFAKIRTRREEIDAVDPDGEGLSDELLAELDELEVREDELRERAVRVFSEQAKATGTVVLAISPDGTVERHYRKARQSTTRSGVGAGGGTAPMSDNLTDAQQSELRTHELLAVREALMGDPLARKRLLVMTLHENVARDAIMMRKHPTGADLYADTNREFRSSLREVQIHRRKEADPFADLMTLSEVGMYERLKDLSEAELDTMLATLAVQTLTNSLGERSSLIGVLMGDLGVNVRQHWTPDASWLKGYTKVQLGHLLGRLQSPAHGSAALHQKKSDLVEHVAEIFKRADEGPDGLGDAELAERVSSWMPSGTVGERVSTVAA